MSDKTLFSIGAIGSGVIAVIFLLLGLFMFNTYHDVALIFLGLSVVMVINIIVILLMSRKYSSKPDNLETVSAIIIKIINDDSITINKKHPYYLIVEYNGNTYRSEYCYEKNKYSVGDNVELYIDPNNSNDYKVIT